MCTPPAAQTPLEMLYTLHDIYYTSSSIPRVYISIATVACIIIVDLQYLFQYNKYTIKKLRHQIYSERKGRITLEKRLQKIFSGKYYINRYICKKKKKIKR